MLLETTSALTKIVRHLPTTTSFLSVAPVGKLYGTLWVTGASRLRTIVLCEWASNVTRAVGNVCKHPVINA